MLSLNLKSFPHTGHHHWGWGAWGWSKANHSIWHWHDKVHLLWVLSRSVSCWCHCGGEASHGSQGLKTYCCYFSSDTLGFVGLLTHISCGLLTISTGCSRRVPYPELIPCHIKLLLLACCIHDPPMNTTLVSQNGKVEVSQSPSVADQFI